MDAAKTLERLLSRSVDASIRFLLEALGFEVRTSGSHHVFRKLKYGLTVRHE